MNSLSADFEKSFKEVDGYIKKRDQAKLLFEHFEKKMEKLISKKSKLKSHKKPESERFLIKYETVSFTILKYTLLSFPFISFKFISFN